MVDTTLHPTPSSASPCSAMPPPAAPPPAARARRRHPGQDFLGLPEGLLRVAGLLLLPYAAFVAWLGTRKGGVPRDAVRALVEINLLWALDSVLLLAARPRRTASASPSCSPRRWW